MEINKITRYVNSSERKGLGRILKLQLKIDGRLASKIEGLLSMKKHKRETKKKRFGQRDISKLTEIKITNHS